MTIDALDAFEETLAALEIRRQPKLPFPADSKEARDLAEGIVGLNNFKKYTGQYILHVARTGQPLVVTLMQTIEPVFLMARESDLILPDDATFVENVGGVNRPIFISLSQPAPFAAQYRQRSNCPYLDNVNSYGPLSPNRFWRLPHTEDRTVIVAQYGTAKPRSTALKPN